jgi:hypothetical protein
VGGQIKWTPAPWINIISNNYGVAAEALNIPHRTRLHTDNSVEIKYYDKPKKFLRKMASTVPVTWAAKTVDTEDKLVFAIMTKF